MNYMTTSQTFNNPTDRMIASCYGKIVRITLRTVEHNVFSSEPDVMDEIHEGILTRRSMFDSTVEFYFADMPAPIIVNAHHFTNSSDVFTLEPIIF